MQSQILLVELIPGKESNVDVEILERGQEEEETQQSRARGLHENTQT